MHASAASNGWRRAGRLAATVGAAGAAAGLGVAAWTQIERRLPVLRRYEAEVDMPAGYGPLRILQISDLHLFAGQEFLVDFVHELADEEFDLVISTGDNFGSLHALDMILEAYRPLMDRPGAFVLGSNDYFSPRAKPWINYLRRSTPSNSKSEPVRRYPDLPWMDMVNHWVASGWVDLSNQCEVITLPGANGRRRLGLIGVDDPHIHRDQVPATTANWDSAECLRLGVTHAPYQRILNEFTTLGADLILAGHTHGGQLCVPYFGAIVTNCDLPRRYASGMHHWGFAGQCSLLHVSAGLGTSMYAPVRFACRPEASLITLTPAGA